MSTALTVLNGALAQGGIGTNSKLFQVKPSTLELVQKMTRQPGAEPGRIRDTGLNTHYDELHIVMLFVPAEQQQLFTKGQFNKESKVCFSLDGITPHEYAKEPKALNCASCKLNAKVGKNWDKWRTTKSPDDVPPCKNYYHLVVADRLTQMPYYLNVKGKSVSEFEAAMKNVARLIAQMTANVKMENKKIKADNDALLATVKEGEPGPELKPYRPLPNIFDISFKIFVAQEPGAANYIFGFKEFAAMNEENRKEFGQVYLDFVSQRNSGLVVDQATVEAEADAAVAASEAAEVDAALVNPAVTIPTGPITGVVVGKDEPITI